ncbi:MAG: hypothetical protein GYB68_15670 [Chloroflexi bacterium]|nr:hypothetical protein [Chloroflexota bacterium]
MTLDTYTVDNLLDQLRALGEPERCFNPYLDAHGRDSERRSANLRRYLLDMGDRQPDVLLLFEAPGYRGCRVSGIPVTSERIMLVEIEKWKLFGNGYQRVSKRSDGIAEMTATILWKALIEIADQPPLIWNTFPLHPFDPRKGELSNRTPMRREQRLGYPLIEQVIALFDLETIVGVGRTAQRALTDLRIHHIEARHPAQGGKADFVAAMQEIYGQ